MNIKSPKKRQPELVRANLLAAAAELISERGLSGITLDLVAVQAGTSKGGLIHHFSSKQSLFEELCRDVLKEYADNIDHFMAEDPEPRGRCIRAYIRATVKQDKKYNYVKLFNAFALEMKQYPGVSKIYQDWYESQLKKMGEGPVSMKAKMLIYSVDGIWVEEATEIYGSTPPERDAFIEYLIEQTYELDA